MVLRCAERACDMRWGRIGLHSDLWLQQVAIDQGIYIRSVCKKVFCEHGSHNLACSAVATFLHGRLLLHAKCVGGLFSVNGELAVMFRLGHWMVLCRPMVGG